MPVSSPSATAAPRRAPVPVRVRMADLAREYRSVQRAVDASIRRVLSSGSYVLGAEVEAFEQTFAQYCGAKHAVGVGSGTAALHLALLAAGIGRGDEVITVPNTDSPTAAAIRHVGAEVVFADVDARTFTMDPAAAAAAVTPRTRALLPVHLFGNPADMDPLMQVARRHQLLVIEDAALAVGAEYAGRRAGSLGHVGCFSLAPGKILGGYGDAGIVVTDDGQIADRIRVLRNYGHGLDMPPPGNDVFGPMVWTVREHGFNERLDALQAAVLRAKLRTLEKRIAQRRQIAAWYEDALADRIQRPVTRLGDRHVFMAYTILLEDRDSARMALAAAGISSRTYYTPPLHLQEPFRDSGQGRGSLPAAERIDRQMLSLPIYPQMSRSDQRLVTEALAGWMNRGVIAQSGGS